ncbi:hypothetical protein [Methanococcus sp. CF]
MNVKFIVITILFISILTAHAWDDCPFGVTNSSCNFPGACGRYIDTNNNQICDHSEPVPGNLNDVVQGGSENASYDELVELYVPMTGKELKTYTIEEVCEYYQIPPESLKVKLGIEVNNDVTIDQVRSIYGLSVTEIKYAIFDCMVEEDLINITENTISVENKSFSERIIDFLFTWIDLRSFW